MTGSGDEGTTTLFGAGRLSKDDRRVALIGDADEANAAVGIARAEAGPSEMWDLLLEL